MALKNMISHLHRIPTEFNHAVKSEYFGKISKHLYTYPDFYAFFLLCSLEYEQS